MRVASFAQGEWIEGRGTPVVVRDAVTGDPVAEVSSEGLDFAGMLRYARAVGGPRLRAMTIHQRAAMLKELARFLLDRKQELYELSYRTGATKRDAWFDVDGGIGTLFAFSSKVRREFPDETFHVEGTPEILSRKGTFIGRHICVPLEGAALHINAFNFPCWGLLEKTAPTWLAGVPAIVKPATVTSYVAEKLVRLIVESGIVPEGALQLICGGVGDIFDHLTHQDVVTFTGSAVTGRRLKAHPSVVENSVRFNMEADSLNFCILGPDARPGTQEFDLFVQEVVREMTIKTGQRCTAIRRTLVPAELFDEAAEALSAALARVRVGDPRIEGVEMGPLVGLEQRREVRANAARLLEECRPILGDPDSCEPEGADPEKGAFFGPLLLACSDPLERAAPHEVEAFGPVNTIMPYRDLDELLELARRGRGSLVGSIFTADGEVARRVVLGTASHHGRLLVVDRHCAAESTGHGSPLPHLVHGGPGRAGGGEELGGARAVLHYMQRTALQGSPEALTLICRERHPGARGRRSSEHPFRKHFEDLEIGEEILTHRRTITETDVVNFAGISGDFFYAHTDEIAARESMFERRVAHGYLVLSVAAGLFVDPAPGPVLANYGLEGLRFIKPVYIGDTIRARLTCKRKTPKPPREGEPRQGVVAWDVEVTNQDEEVVAAYTILTLVKCRSESPTEARDARGPGRSQEP
ncbi:MAG: phenylacetic acid degradation bifunctional protein PaaZ [Acidobacteria bacterium]|nr:MAG: phenylacetic acid degradation bifunctional protein PaaZ [Acidobacteriota bacterium]